VLDAAADAAVRTKRRQPLVLQGSAVIPDGLLFRSAVAILALHATIDSFVSPEPGISPRDHLLRGLTSLVLLTGLVVAYPRLRAGGRAVLAAVVGALALEGAALAIEDARAVGARGEDWTGFLLLPVGLVLLGLAAVLLWGSRKSGRFRWFRRAAILIGSLLAAYWVVLPVAIAILATHRPRADVQPAALGAPYKQVTLTTRDGLDLAAWYVPSRNGAAVVSYPTRTGKVPQARMLVRHGYGVLLLDARGYDGSQGDANLFGWDDAKDIDTAVAWLRQQPDVQGGRIGGIGFSVGGEMMLQAAASNEALRAVVSEGAGFRSVREDVQRGPRGWFTLPEAAVQTAAIAVMTGTTPPPPLKDLVPRIAPRSVFFIYAGHGAGGEEFNPDLYQAARAPKALWKIAEARHVGGFDARPREYERRVVGFFDRVLLGGERPAIPG
jgi:dienelactone hydrolase